MDSHAFNLNPCSLVTSLSTDQGLPSPSLADVNYMKIMMTAVKKYELVLKCNEMISDSMFHHIATLYKHTSQDLFIHAVIDWIILGCYTCSHHHDTFDTIDARCCPSLLAISALPPKRAGKYMTSRPSAMTQSCSPCSASASRRTMTMVNHSHTTVASTLVGSAPRKPASTSYDAQYASTHCETTQLLSIMTP